MGERAKISLQTSPNHFESHRGNGGKIFLQTSRNYFENNGKGSKDLLKNLPWVGEEWKPSPLKEPAQCTLQITQGSVCVCVGGGVEEKISYRTIPEQFEDNGIRGWKQRSPYMQLAHTASPHGWENSVEPFRLDWVGWTFLWLPCDAMQLPYYPVYQSTPGFMRQF